MTKKAIAYIDGFNLYYALRHKRWQRYYWLNLQELAQKILKPGQTLVYTKYFTARVIQNPGKESRQNAYIDALSTLKDFEVIEGRYQRKKMFCTRCKKYYYTYEEKMTDVNIAISLLEDAFFNRYDVALLISADGDLTTPITTIKRLFPSKEVIVAVPPGNFSTALQAVADDYLPVWRSTLKTSLFPKTLKRADGKMISRPASWK